MTSTDAATNLLKIKRVDPRTIWKHEATEFTPWLFDHVAELNEAIGFEIELASQEESVGAFSVDLFGTEVQTGHNAIIENQLEPTDHGHLGQLMTYAAGLKAGVIIWISPRFRDEHREALIWLNEVSSDEVNFFGVEVEVLEIGDQRAANFKVVAQPDAWRKSHAAAKKQGGATSERQLAYQAFFQALIEDFKARLPGATSASRAQPASWFAFASGLKGSSFVWSFTSDGRFRTELYLDVGDKDRNLEILERLENDVVVTGNADELGALAFERLESRRGKRIASYAPSHATIDSSEQELSGLRDWAVESMAAFVGTFRPLVKDLG